MNKYNFHKELINRLSEVKSPWNLYELANVYINLIKIFDEQTFNQICINQLEFDFKNDMVPFTSFHKNFRIVDMYDDIFRYDGYKQHINQEEYHCIFLKDHYKKGVEMNMKSLSGLMDNVMWHLISMDNNMILQHAFETCVIEYQNIQNLKFYSDGENRHIVCIPYSEDNLHLMAKSLNLDKSWFHRDHYDMPKKRISELSALTTIISTRDIVRIKNGEYKTDN